MDQIMAFLLFPQCNVTYGGVFCNVCFRIFQIGMTSAERRSAGCAFSLSEVLRRSLLFGGRSVILENGVV